MDDMNIEKNSQECSNEPKKRTREKQLPLSKCFTSDTNTTEIGVDEVGRGPLFGRVYVAAVILPKDDSFDHSKMKDSKKFHSKKKIEEVSEYIKKSALAWAICYEDEKVIDEINILQATQRAMHKCIGEILKKEKLLFERDTATTDKKIQLIIDGNYFGNTIAYAAQFTQCLSIYYLDDRASPSFTWAETPRNIIISNNIFDGFNATLHGSSYFCPIYLITATSVLVQGNVFRDMALGASPNDMSSCVWIEGCRNILVDGNSMSMKNGTGVSLHATCFEISVVNNQMLDDLNKSFVLNYGIRITKEYLRPDPVIYQSKFIGNTISCSLSAFRNLYTAAGSMTDCIITDNVFLQECSMQTLSKSIVSNNIFSVSSTRNQCLALGNLTAITAHNTVVGNKFNTPSGTPKIGAGITRMRGSTISNNMFQTATYAIYVQGTNVAGELDYLNIKDNFSISQTQPNFPTYSTMAAADTALLQSVNNQKIT